MKRRSFLTQLAALTTLPVLPASVAAAPALSAKQIRTATLLARSHNHCSVDMLARLMKLTPNTAQGLFTTLQRQGIVTAPIAGASIATQPLNTHCVPVQALKRSNLNYVSDALKDRIKTMLRQDPQPQDPPDHDVPSA